MNWTKAPPGPKSCEAGQVVWAKDHTTPTDPAIPRDTIFILARINVPGRPIGVVIATDGEYWAFAGSAPQRDLGDGKRAYYPKVRLRPFGGPPIDQSAIILRLTSGDLQGIAETMAKILQVE